MALVFVSISNVLWYTNPHQILSKTEKIILFLWSFGLPESDATTGGLIWSWDTLRSQPGLKYATKLLNNLQRFISIFAVHYPDPDIECMEMEIRVHKARTEYSTCSETVIISTLSSQFSINIHTIIIIIIIKHHQSFENTSGEYGPF